MGRVLRIALGLFMLMVALPYYLYPLSPVHFLIFTYSSNLISVLQAVVLNAALFAFFISLHVIISRYFTNINTWVGAVLALAPVVVLFYLGGARAIAALTYVGISLLLAGVRGDPGCEVVSIPNLLFRKRIKLACILFTPIDYIEGAVKDRHKEK